MGGRIDFMEISFVNPGVNYMIQHIMRYNKSEGNDYIKQYPSLKKWINTAFAVGKVDISLIFLRH